MTTPIPAASAGNRPNWTLADRLRKAREDAGLEQEELARTSGLSRGTISAAENGHRSPSRASLAMWAMATGVSRAWLTGDESPNADDLSQLRMTALLALITASRHPNATGHDRADAVLEAVAQREHEVQDAGAWEASSAINHPEVVAWCEEYRPELAAALNMPPKDYKPIVWRDVAEMDAYRRRRAIAAR